MTLPENASFVPDCLYRLKFGPVLNLSRCHFSTGSKFKSPKSQFSTGPNHRPVLNVAFYYRSVLPAGTKKARPFSTGR